MKRIKMVTLFISFCFSISVYAQDSLTYELASIVSKNDKEGISIGQHVPDMVINKIVNYKSNSVRLSDLQGKYVILDFWHQFCTVCIKAFPKLYELQKRFGDSLLILPVTFQSKISVLSFYAERRKAGKPLLLPSATEDTTLHKLFPHAGDPHEIWVDKKGKVSAITNHLAVTEENISKWLQSGNINLPVKNDLMDFDDTKPLLVSNNGAADSAFVFRSLFTNYLEHVRGGATMAVESEKIKRIFIKNQTMESMYRFCYQGLGNSPFENMNDIMISKRMILETSDSSRDDYWAAAYKAGYEEELNFCKKNIFSYELIVPSRVSMNNAFKIAIKDLDAFFGITSTVEKRKIKCFELTKRENADIMLSSFQKQSYLLDDENSAMRFSDEPVSFIVDKINSNCNVPLIIDKTNYKENVDMMLPYNGGIQVIKKSFEQCGFELIEKEYVKDVLVLKDSKSE